MTTPATASVVQAHFAASLAASERFFEAEASRIAECCQRMAERFACGGTLFVAGEGAQASDAQHVSVEFVHPILVGKRALPAVALTSDSGVVTASAGRAGYNSFAAPLNALARSDDLLLALSTQAMSPAIGAAMTAARRVGLFSVFVNGRAVSGVGADMEFVVGHSHPFIVQEITETLYHVLWELVHVFLEARDAEALSYFPGAPRSDGPNTRAFEQVVASTRMKARDIAALRRAMLERSEEDIAAAGARMAERCARGGRLLTFGNGGSATDAQDAVADAMVPPVTGWRALPALALTNDIGVVTAIGNDVGFEHVFARQVAAFGQAGDIALGFSTSGASRNVLSALSAAKARGLLTLAMSGGDGGALARSTDVDFCFTAPSEQLPRIQEAHATTWHALLSATQEALS